MIRRLLFAASALALTACSPAAETPAASPDPVEPVSSLAPEPVPAKASPTVRETLTSAVMIDPGAMQEAASVSQLHLMPEIDAKVLSLSGGDPAVNGLVTYLALHISPAEGWRLYPIGDFTSWRVTDSAPGRVQINYRRDTDGPAGDIVQRRGRVVLEWTRMADGSPPDRVAVATQPSG